MAVGPKSKADVLAPDRLSVDAHCQLLGTFMCERVTSIYDGFKSYVTLISALIGGSVALRLQFSDRIVPSYAYAADAIAVLLWIVATITIADNYRSWWKLRIRYSEVAGVDEAGKLIVPRPAFWSSVKVQATMLAVITVTLGMFLLFNPLRHIEPSAARKPQATASSSPSNIRRPSVPPCAASMRRSGCGIMPITLPALFSTPAMLRADPLTSSA
jgi:hypothetical protein